MSSGWWFQTFGLLFHILGMSSSQLTNHWRTHIFQRGRFKPPTRLLYSPWFINDMHPSLWDSSHSTAVDIDMFFNLSWSLKNPFIFLSFGKGTWRTCAPWRLLCTWIFFGVNQIVSNLEALPLCIILIAHKSSGVRLYGFMVSGDDISWPLPMKFCRCQCSHEIEIVTPLLPNSIRGYLPMCHASLRAKASDAGWIFTSSTFLRTFPIK